MTVASEVRKHPAWIAAMLAVVSIASLPSSIKSLAIPPYLSTILGVIHALGGSCGERDEGRSIPQAREIIST
jgi:hypothetical protein